MPIEKEIRELGREQSEFGIAVEDMRNTLETVKFDRHVHITELLCETDAVVDGNRGVFIAVEDGTGGNPAAM